MSSFTGNVSSAAAQWYQALAATKDHSNEDRYSDMKKFAKYELAIQLANLPKIKEVLQDEGVTVTKTGLEFSTKTDFDVLQDKMLKLSNKFNV